MNVFKRSLIGLAVAAACSAGAAQAQISDNVVKIGVLSDMSSLYTDLAGAGSVVLPGEDRRGRPALVGPGEGPNLPSPFRAISAMMRKRNTRRDRWQP